MAGEWMAPALRMTSSASIALTGGRQHAGGPVAVEQHPVHQRVAPHLEVGSGAGGLQVGVVGRDPPAVARRERDRG